MVRQVNAHHTDYARRREQWARIRDAMEGADEIKAQGEAYLPKPEGMTAQAYLAYKTRAHFYSVSERTLRGMSGMVFRHHTTFKLPKALEPLREAATTDGHSLDVMAENVFNEVLSVGRYGLLVDYPSGNTSATSIPYIATYSAENITDWRVQFVDGLRVLTRVVLKDDFDEDDDTNDVAEQRLELLLNDEGNYEVRRWVSSTAAKKTKGETATFLLESATVPLVGGKPIKRIPFVFVNPYDLRPEVEKPPFLDLVDTNLALYRNSADYEQSLFLVSQPTPWVAGNLNEKQVPTQIGSGAFWVLPEGATAGMLEFSGAGLEAMVRAMSDKKDDLATLGARMINEGKNRNEASDTARMRGRGELSLMANVVNTSEAGIERALRIAAEWVTGRPDEVEVRINRDWVEARMESNELTALVKAWQAGALSHATLYENLQRGEIANVDRTLEEELELIEEEGGSVGQDMITAIVDAATKPPGQAVPPGQTAPTPDDPGNEEAAGNVERDE